MHDAWETGRILPYFRWIRRHRPLRGTPSECETGPFTLGFQPDVAFLPQSYQQQNLV